LLRVLAEKEVTPVGSETPIKTDFRVVSATHRDLRARTDKGEFREDLMFRLQGLTVRLPALRSRSDVVELAQRLLKEEQAAIGHELILAPCAKAFIQCLPWPGNVRQLKQVLTTAAWLSDTITVQAADIDMALESDNPEVSPQMTSSSGLRSDVSDDDDRSLLLHSLKRNRWNVSLTAREFNAARTTIYRRMARFGIVQPHLQEN
jgi:transcriptional regulator of acetoin/glycerol metabolism